MALVFYDSQRPRYGDITVPEASAILGGEVAAISESSSDSALRSIGIGVATGALTFITVEILKRWFK